MLVVYPVYSINVKLILTLCLSRVSYTFLLPRCVTFVVILVMVLPLKLTE
jgi:hypothetical protein